MAVYRQLEDLSATALKDQCLLVMGKGAQAARLLTTEDVARYAGGLEEQNGTVTVFLDTLYNGIRSVALLQVLGHSYCLQM